MFPKWERNMLGSCVVRCGSKHWCWTGFFCFLTFAKLLFFCAGQALKQICAQEFLLRLGWCRRWLQNTRDYFEPTFYQISIIFFITGGNNSSYHCPTYDINICKHPFSCAATGSGPAVCYWHSSLSFKTPDQCIRWAFWFQFDISMTGITKWHYPVLPSTQWWYSGWSNWPSNPWHLPLLSSPALFQPVLESTSTRWSAAPLSTLVIFWRNFTAGCLQHTIIFHLLKETFCTLIITYTTPHPQPPRNTPCSK